MTQSIDNITLFSKPGCTFCVQAKTLLTANAVPYTEIIVDIGQDKEPGLAYVPLAEFKASYPTVKSLPYITSAGEPIGGFRELQAVIA